MNNLFLKVIIITIKLALLIYTVDLVVYYGPLLGDWLGIVVLALIFSIIIFGHNIKNTKKLKRVMLLSLTPLIGIFFYIKTYTFGDPLFRLVKGGFDLRTFEAVLAIVTIASVFLVENITINLIERKAPFNPNLDNGMSHILDDFE